MHDQTRDSDNDGLVPGPVSAERLAGLRSALSRLGLDGCIVPHADPQHCENLPRYAERLLWLTGFTGSAGVAVVLAESAALFVDGRYTLQAEDQVDNELFERRHVTDDPPPAWIAANLNGGRLGYDPWLHTPDGVEKFRAACAEAGGEFPEKVTAFREGRAVHGRYRQPCPDRGTAVQRIRNTSQEAAS